MLVTINKYVSVPALVTGNHESMKSHSQASKNMQYSSCNDFSVRLWGNQTRHQQRHFLFGVSRFSPILDQFVCVCVCARARWAEVCAKVFRCSEIWVAVNIVW